MPVQRLQKFQSLHRLLTSCPEDVTLNTDIVITLESRGSAAVCFPPDPGVCRRIAASISVSGFMLLNERRVRDTGNLIWGF